MNRNQSRISRPVPQAQSIVFLLFLCTILLPQCKKDGGSSATPTTISLQLVAQDFVSPIQVLYVHNSDRRYVVDQIGKVFIIDKDDVKKPTPFLDISSKLISLNPNYDERGLLGMAFHPEYKTTGRVFVYYQLPPRAGGPVTGATWNNLSRISEFKVMPDLSKVDPNSEKVILEWDDPQSNHNGGALAFGLDDYLYIAVGDGGGSNDTGPGHVDDWYTANTGGNSQNIEANFLGKVLCIDIDNGTPYVAPPTNPFVNKPGRDEIFAFGFRNPYRMTFDIGGEHQMLLSDAGQALWEEINVLKKGANYGWNVREGSHCFNAAENTKGLPTCPTVDDRGKPLLDPVIEIKNYQNPLGGKATTIIGGYVYRGSAIPGWNGKYIFGSFSQSPTTPNGELFLAHMKETTELSSWEYEEINLQGQTGDTGYYIKGFGQDDEGEVYVTVSSTSGPQGTTGKVFKLVPATAK